MQRSAFQNRPGAHVDVQTRESLKQLAAAVDSVAGMVAGTAAYIATLDGAAYVDKRKALGLSQKLVPQGVSGQDGVAPARVAQAMIEQISGLARELQSLRTRIDRPAQIAVEREEPQRPFREESFRNLSRFTKTD